MDAREDAVAADDRAAPDDAIDAQRVDSAMDAMDATDVREASDADSGASDGSADSSDASASDVRDASADSADASAPGCVITNVTDPTMGDDQIWGAWALGPGEVPHFAVLDGPFTNRQVVLSKLVGGAWQRTTLSVGATAFGTLIALSVDRDGAAHIAFLASVPTDGGATFGVRYAQVTSAGAVTTQTIATGWQPTTLAIATASNGRPTVLYQRDTAAASNILAAQRNADGSWTERDVGCALPLSSITIQAASSSLGAHVSAMVIPRDAMAQQRVVYATETAGGASWRCETVRALTYSTSVASRTHSIAVTDAGDAVTIAFRERTFTPSDSTPLWFARWESTRWNIVRSFGNAGPNPLFAADAASVLSLSPVASSPPAARLERYDIAAGSTMAAPGSHYALASSIVPAQAWMARGGRAVIAAFTRPTSVLASTYELVHATCDLP